MEINFNQYIIRSLLIAGVIFLLCIVFATDISLANGLVAGKVFWFHLAMLFSGDVQPDGSFVDKAEEAVCFFGD